MTPPRVGSTDPELCSGFRQALERMGPRPGPRHPQTSRPEVPQPSQACLSAILSTPRLHDLYRRWTGEGLPWIPDASPVTRHSLERLTSMVEDWRRHHRSAPRQSLELAREIFSWVNEPAGLGMEIAEDYPEANLNEALLFRAGDCSEYTYLLLALFRRAGFTVQPHWVTEDQNGLRVSHLATALHLNGREYLMDPVYGSFRSRHRRHVPISERQLLGFFWSNRALDFQAADPRRALGFYRRALTIDPGNPQIWVNRGILLQGLGRMGEAEADFRRALNLDGRNSLAWEWLGHLAVDAGEERRAGRYFRRAIRGNSQNLNARMSLIDTLTALGQDRAAARELRALRQIQAQLRQARGRTGVR